MARSDRPNPGETSVLLVDGDRASALAQRRRLQDLGYHVVEASDPGAALAIARQSSPRVIFLGIGDSGSGRSGFLQSLRSDDSTRHIPVVMMSSGRDHSAERMGLRSVGREHW
jgi:PleD family two-component response regulator